MSQPEERDPWAPPADDGSADRPPGGSAPDSAVGTAPGTAAGSAPDPAPGSAPDPAAGSAPGSAPDSAPPPGGPGHSFGTAGDSSGRQQPTAGGRASQRGLLLFAISALLASFAFPPVGFAMCGFTVVWAVRARRRARATGGTAPGSAVSLGLAAVGLVVPLVLLSVFFDQLTTYQSCMSGANTHEAKNDCRQALENGLLERLGQR